MLVDTEFSARVVEVTGSEPNPDIVPCVLL